MVVRAKVDVDPMSTDHRLVSAAFAEVNADPSGQFFWPRFDKKIDSFELISEDSFKVDLTRERSLLA